MGRALILLVRDPRTGLRYYDRRSAPDGNVAMRACALKEVCTSGKRIELLTPEGLVLDYGRRGEDRARVSYINGVGNLEGIESLLP